jgi:hypothetical protein
MLNISCSCGKVLQVKDDLAGKRIKCPACAALLMVTGSATAALQDKNRSHNQDEEDEEAENNQTPGKKREPTNQQGSHLQLLLLLGGAAAVFLLLMVAVVGLGAYFLFFQGSAGKTGTAGGKNEASDDDQATRAERSRESLKNLSQIGFALHDYHDQHKQFPPWAACNQDGKPLLSWRVLILPFLQQGALFAQFKLDEPWDSAHNRKLLNKMPAVFAAPGIKTKEPGLTYYQGFVGQGAGWELNPSANQLYGARCLRMPGNFPDGTSNTIMVIEAKEPVPWTKPADLPYEKGKPLPAIGGVFKDRANVVLFDASVRGIPLTWRAATLEAAITPAGGEIMPEEWNDLPR